MTEPDQPTRAADPLASQRVELLGKLAAAQFLLETVIAELVRAGASPAEATNQLAMLATLQHQVGTAGPAALLAMRTEVSVAIAQAQTAAQRAQHHARNAAELLDDAELEKSAAASRRAVMGVMRDLHKFDACLTFDTPEDEAEYRRREAERRNYIDAELAKQTPEGDLNASGGAVGQMLDAHAHGAGNSPEFRQRWDELVATTERLREAARANGVSTEEFDRRLSDDIRHTLRTKGYSDTQIDAMFAAHHGDPLEVAKECVRDESDIQTLSASVSFAAQRGSVDRPSGIRPVNDDPLALSGADISATLKAAGITASEHPAGEEFAHGVSQGQPLAAPGYTPGAR